MTERHNNSSVESMRSRRTSGNRTEKRNATRSRIGGKFEAEVQYRDPYDNQRSNIITARGRIDDLGSKGIFLSTGDEVPLEKSLDIRILFEPMVPDGLSMKARGVAVRKTPEGVGIKFTDINVGRLGECVMEMLSRE